MGTSEIKGGQRTNLSGDTGKKARSETSQPHKGSRLEPSHVTERQREDRDKKSKAHRDVKQAPDPKEGAGKGHAEPESKPRL